MGRKIPTTVFTGFLGAGKTSLIRHVISHAGGRRIALVINEFGDLGVDRDLISACGIEGCGDEDIVELTNGCICCTVADDFVPTMTRLINRDPAPEHIIIETSGLALPKPLVKAFQWPEIRNRVTVDGVIALVDGPATAAGLFAHDPEAINAARASDEALDHESPLEELFEEQVACADMVILSKCDLLDEAGKSAARKEIAHHLRSGVQIIESRNGEVDPTILLGLSAAAEDDLESRPSHHDDHNDDHDHDDFDSVVVDLPQIADPRLFAERLEGIIQDHGLLRVKGFAAVEGKPMRCVIQAVGQRVDRYFDRPWAGDETPQTRLVVIGPHGMDTGRITRDLTG